MFIVDAMAWGLVAFVLGGPFIGVAYYWWKKKSEIYE